MGGVLGKADMEATPFSDTCPLPEDFMMMIVALLPVKDLLRLRCISKWWNDVPKSQRIHQMRPTLCQEFAAAVMSYLQTKRAGGGIEVVKCVGGAVLLYCANESSRYNHADIYVMQPAAMSFRRLPKFVGPLPHERLRAWAKGIVVNGRTNSYTVFVCSWEFYMHVQKSKYEPFRIVPDLSKEQMSRRWLHFFDSATQVWTSCATYGLDKHMSVEDTLVYFNEITVHRGRYTIWAGDTVMSYNNSGRWEALPGQLPTTFPGSRPLPLSFSKPFAFFESRGKLYLAAVRGGPDCTQAISSEWWEHGLWVYMDEAMEWVPVLSHRYECKGEKVVWYETFVQGAGDFFHFGIFAPPADHDAEALVAGRIRFSIRKAFRQRMTYNLLTGELEDLSRDLEHGSPKQIRAMVMRGSTKYLIPL